MKPWRRLSSQVVIEDRWLHVTADRCELPSGVVLDPYYVVHESDWVHVLALNDQSEVLVVRQYRYAGDAVCTELPGGVIDPGETPLVAAQRELLEETGHTAASWIEGGWLFANPARQTNKVFLFLAEGLVKEGAQQLDRSEEIEFEFLAHAEIEAAINAGQFSQALHVASYHRGIAIQPHRPARRDDNPHPASPP